MIARTSAVMGVFTAREFHFADFTLDRSTYRLQRGERLMHLEKLPMELLILLVERRGELVSRHEIAERLWGKDVFLETDRSINTAIGKVRVALRDDPQNPRFVETVVGKGYRFAAPIVFNNGDSDPQEQPLPPPVQAESDPPVPSSEKRFLSIRISVLVGAVVVLAFLAGDWLIGRWDQRTKHSTIESLAVLPLKNLSGDPTQEYFAEGMTEALIGRLSLIQNLRVVSRTSVMSFKDTHVSAPEIAKSLHVDALVEGSVIREGSRIRVTAQLIRGATDEHFWSETYDRDLRDAFALQSEVAQSIAGRVEVTLTGKERARLVSVRHIAPEVYESYLKGRFGKSNTKAEVEQSVAYFKDAIRQDPTFAPAYVSLASAYGAMGSPYLGASPDEVRPKMIAALSKALELDPEVAEANLILAVAYENQWQWAESAAEFKRALALNPNDAGAHLGFGHWLLFQGRTEEAIAWCQRARELDPLGTGTDMGWILFQARHYDEAIRELRSAVAVAPDDAYAHWFLGFALIANGQPNEAIASLEKARSLSGGSPPVIGVLARAYAHAGRRTEALRLVDELKRRQQKGYVPAAAFVQAYLAIGDNEQAFAWLERAYQEKSEILAYLKVESFFDPLRSDPRFADLVRRVGLPQ